MIYPHWIYRLEGFPENPEKWLVRTPEEDANMGPGFTDPYGVRCPVVDVLGKLENIDMVQEHVEIAEEPIPEKPEIQNKRGGWPKGKPRKGKE